VLLVDDNEEWAAFLAEDIEQCDPTMSVTVVGSANEAMLVLRECDGVDCVVSDHRMPEVDLPSLGAVVRPTAVTPARAVVEAEPPTKWDRRSFVDVLEERYGSATMRSCVETERDEAAENRTDTSSLTEKRRRP